MKLKVAQNIMVQIVLIFAIMINLTEAQVIPTDEWVSFYGRNTLFQGKPIPIGSVIDAYDHDGVHCGSFTVTKAGQYGFLFVYRDNYLTENIDEGASPGDTIRFKINGMWAKASGPDPCIWTQKGDIWQVDFADNLPPVQITAISDLILLEDAPDTMIADLDEVYTDPDGDSLYFSATSDQAAVLPHIDSDNRLHISLRPEWSGLATVIVTIKDLWFEIHDTLAVQVKEINDPPVILNLPDTSFSCDTNLILNLNDYVTDVDHPLSSLMWQAEVQPPYQDSLIVEIDNVEKTATFQVRYRFSATLAVIFKVFDDSLGFDIDTITVRVTYPSATETKHTIPRNIELMQNFPNPFNETTTISYYLPAMANVELQIYSPLGQKIIAFVFGKQPSGFHSIQWKAETLGSGIYLMVLTANGFTYKRKMLLLK